MDKLETQDPSDWLIHLNEKELAHWEAKEQSSKDWWHANTKPDDRGKLLRSEIAAASTHNKILQLPKVDREALIKRLNKEADAAEIRLRQHLAK